MKKIFSTLALSLVLTTSVYADNDDNTTTNPPTMSWNYNSQKPISCTSPKNIRYILGDQLGELPYFQGDGIAAATDGKSFIRTNLIISVNLETRTFSVVEILNDGLACIIGGGDKFQFNVPKVGTDKTNIVLGN